MTKKKKGLGVVQEGADFGTAPDWQHVFDTRWRFMEVWDEIEAEVTVPFAEAAPDNESWYWQKVEIQRHGLDFHPAFHGHKKLIGGSSDSGDERFLYVDDKRLMMAVEVGQSDKQEVTYKIKAIIYNLPILEDYKAPVEPLNSYNLRSEKVGVRMLDDDRKDVNITERDPDGFSIDTTKRILSVHKTGFKWINEQEKQDLRLESVNTSTDTFTYTKWNEDDGVGYAWVRDGAKVFTDFFGDYPSPIQNENTNYYVIKLSETELQLAETKSDAENGNQIDITDTGDLPQFLNRSRDDLTAQEKYEENKILHDIGYPPSFLIAEIDRDNDDYSILLPSLKHISFRPLFNATDDYIALIGVQSVYVKEVAFILLKDPVEVAQ